MLERESGFYVVGLSTGEKVIMEYVHGNGWQRVLSQPDVYITDVFSTITI
jgi:hypothetical protein